MLCESGRTQQGPKPASKINTSAKSVVPDPSKSAWVPSQSLSTNNKSSNPMAESLLKSRDMVEHKTHRHTMLLLRQTRHRPARIRRLRGCTGRSNATCTGQLRTSPHWHTPPRSLGTLRHRRNNSQAWRWCTWHRGSSKPRLQRKQKVLSNHPGLGRTSHPLKHRPKC